MNYSVSKLREAAAKGHGSWLWAAVEAIKQLAEMKDEITSDDVWMMLDGTISTEARSMGAAFKTAMYRGYVRSTDRVRPSARPQCRQRPVRIWLSTVRGEKR